MLVLGGKYNLPKALMASWSKVVREQSVSYSSTFRQGKVDSLFPISHFADFEEGGWSLFIIDYAEVILFMYVKIRITCK